MQRALDYGRAMLKKHGPGHFLAMFLGLVGKYGVRGAFHILCLRLREAMPARRRGHYMGEGAKPLLHAHTIPVDIIVCVHNALEDVERCLASVAQYTLPPYRLILVDDGSAQPTRDFLADYAVTQGATLLRNEEAQGYTKAANQGLAVSDAPWAVLLNSDCIVTPYWLDRMAIAALSHSRIGMVGPLSNAASWQSIPEVASGEDWAQNALPEGIDADAMALLFGAAAPRLTPEVGFLNGFCLMLRRSMREQIGAFDEATFGAGYGEENDYCLRARAAGWRLIVADDAYIYHAQSKSYSHARRRELCEKADAALHAKHGAPAIAQGLAMTAEHPALLGLRAKARHLAARRALIEDTRQRFEGKRIAFLLPARESGGGGNVIVREAAALAEMGVSAEIVNLAVNREGFEKNFPHLPLPARYIEHPDRLHEALKYADAVVGTLYSTMEWITGALRQGVRPVVGYYAQDFEPYFFPPEDPRYLLAWNSYAKIPGMRVLTKSRWNQQEILKQTGVTAAALGPSYAWDLYHPGALKAQGAETVRVAAMIRPSTPRRAPEMTLRVLKALKKACGDRITVTVFGVRDDDPALRGMATDFPHRNAGELSVDMMPCLLDACDVFLDFSTYQAMGLTALESMASALAVIAPLAGGSGEFIRHGENGLLVDTSDEKACLEVALRLVNDPGLREKLQKQAVQDVAQYYPEKAARRMLDALFADGAAEGEEGAHAAAHRL